MSGGLLIPPGPVRVLVATKPVDFRKGMNGLAALVQEQLKADPFSGTIYCFRAKRADRVKLVFWDGTGLCLLCKRLEDGKFRWPRVQDGVMRLGGSPRQFPGQVRRSRRGRVDLWTGQGYRPARSSQV
jgi:transposase